VWDINGNITFNWKRRIAYKICKLLLRVQMRGDFFLWEVCFHLCVSSDINRVILVHVVKVL
jgi:hypothetical protein